MKLEFKEPKKVLVEDKVIFSSGVIGDHAQEGSELNLFVIPRGQWMPQIPFDAHLCHACRQPAGRLLTETETNLMQAGQLGSAIGEARFDRVRAVLTGGDPVSLDASFELRIAGKSVMKTTLAELVKDWVAIEDEIPMVESSGGRLLPAQPMKVPYTLVARTDTVEGRIKMNREAKIAGAPLVVRIEIAAKVIKPERLEDVHDHEALGALVRET